MMDIDFTKCKTIREMKKEYLEKKGELNKILASAIKERLKEIHMDGLVRRKGDGRLGWLMVYGSEIEFHPKTKTGAPSKISSGWSIDIEEDYEPAEES